MGGMHHKTLLFDFDGTIAATVEAGVAIFNQLAERHGFSEITPGNTDDLRSKGPREAMKALSIPAFRAPFVLRRLRIGIRRELPSIRTVRNMRPTLLALKQKGYFLGIVTSNSRENVLEFLKNNHIDFFDHIEGDVGLFGKARAIKRAIAQNRLPENGVVFVGDEIRDVEAAKKNGIPVIAVTWGTNSRAGFMRVRPDYIVDTTEELLKILA